MKFIQRRIKTRGQRLIAWLAILAIFSGMFFGSPLISPAPAQAATLNSITITGDGVENPLTLTPDDLRAMTQVRQIFSASNTYPTKKFYAAEGVRLTDILARAGIKDTAQTLTFSSSDGYVWKFSKQYLETERYYYPNLLTDSTEGQTSVVPLIALLSSEAQNYDSLNANDAPRLFYGQRALSEQTTDGFIKYLNKIEVSTTAEGQCAMPAASPAPGTVLPGTKVTLQTLEASAKIYYTTDGTTPDLNSPIFNRSNWNPNPPLDILQDTTIKAKVYNYSKQPSEVQTFAYMVDEGATTPVVVLTAPFVAQTYYPGDSVTISGTVLNLSAVDVSVAAPGGQEVYSCAALAVEDGKFSTSFTLAAEAALGNYTVSVTGEGLSQPTTVFFQVKEDSSAIGGPNDGSKPDQIITSWSGDPKGNRVISWRIKKDSGQNFLQCLPAEGFSGSFSGAPTTFVGAVTDLDAQHSRVSFNLNTLVFGSGQTLPSGTRLVYHVGKEGAWSDPAYFTTAEADSQAPFTFFYMGDVQEGYGQWGRMLRDAYAANPQVKFGLLGGDMVNDGESSEDWSKFFAAATPVFQEIGLFPAPGNHDDTELYYKSFSLAQNGPQGFDKKFYSFDYGNARFVVLDSNLLGSAADSNYTVISEWLKSRLRSGKVWNFVVLHHPPYPARAGEVQTTVLQEDWVPIFEECGVDMVFMGHQHLYMRTYPLKGGQVQSDPADGIVYVMGNAGTKFYEPDSFAYMAQVAANTSNYQTISINGPDLTLTARDLEGQVIDSYAIHKEPSLTITAPVAGSVYLPGENISIRGTARNLMKYTYRLLGPEGNEIKKNSIDITSTDGTIYNAISTSRDLAPGEYTMEITGEGVAELYTVKINLDRLVTIYGDGVSAPYTLSYEELQAMPQVNAAYSMREVFNTYAPVPAEGVKLSDLLTRAGIKPEATLIRLTQANGDTATFTLEELFEQPRFYYPNLAQGSTEGQTAVEALLTLRTGGGMDISRMGELQDNRLWFNLVLGQRTLNDLNWRTPGHPAAAGIKEIEVLTTLPEKSAPPAAWPPGLPVPLGTQIYFYHPDSSDFNKHVVIYYTLDGSTPTLDTPTLESRGVNLNRPAINEATTIKAIAYQTGKLPSDVVTYHYTVNQEANDDLVIYSPVNGQFCRPGDKLAFIWASRYGSSRYTVSVAGPDGGTVYQEENISHESEKFGQCFVREFTLPADAALGEYTAKVERFSGGPFGTETHVFTVTNDLEGGTPPVLSADTSGNTVRQAVAITFTDDPAWRAAITSVAVKGNVLDGSWYTAGAGLITIDGSVFNTAGDYSVVVKAAGYADTGVIQPITQAVYTVAPVVSAAYRIDATPDGISTMTVNSGITGLKYFGAQITPVREHEGQEAVVFTHQRSGAQLSVNVTKADFDLLNAAQAGFNVQAGDIVKVYMVDDLTNALDCNPIILQ